MSKSELNISSAQGAVSAMLACINIYRLIPPLLSLAAPLENRVPLFQDIQRPHGTVITHSPKHVLKKIYDAESFFSEFGTSFEDVKVGWASFLVIAPCPKSSIFLPACNRRRMRLLKARPTWFTPSSPQAYPSQTKG